ncbi:MAG TPA: hypothetical protein VGI40_16735 [Pirellulaceae bacterium]
MNEVVPHQRLKQPAIVRWLKIIFVVWICMKFGGCILMLPGPWGPRVGGILPNGHSIYFQARPVGRETDDRLTWVSPDGNTVHLWVDQTHAGFGHVTIKYTNNGDRVWVEADGKVGASIDLVTSDFRDEHDQQHPWAIMGGGTSLDSGSTGSIIWLLGPC